MLEGDFALARYPIVPGHEFCGEVVAVGSQVINVREGDFVAVDPNLPCGHCRFCRMGRFNLCENFDAIGITRDGACAELVRVVGANAFKLPDELPRRWGTLVEPLSCSVHAFDQIQPPVASSYLIYGAGNHGLARRQPRAPSWRKSRRHGGEEPRQVRFGQAPCGGPGRSVGE